MCACPFNRELPTDWKREGEHDRYNGSRENTIDNRVRQHLLDEFMPLIMPSYILIRSFRLDVIDTTHPLLRQVSYDEVVAWLGCTYHIRCEEGGNNRYSNNYWVEVVTDNM